MKLTEMAKKVSKIEALKKQVNIAQIAEILKAINALTDGAFYKLVRSL